MTTVALSVLGRTVSSAVSKKKDEDSCTDFIIDYTNTAEMLMKYPTDDWMVGCDDKW